MSIAALIVQIDEIAVRRHVEVITGIGPRSVDDPDAVFRTLDYLKSCLQEYGYRVLEESYGERPYELNLLAEVIGTGCPGKVFELAAHYDTVRGSPGADDNTSGVAGSLEIARVLAGADSNRTMRFCFFGAEESGLRGSAGHVEHINRNKTQHVEGMVVFEMIGYRTTQRGSQRTPVRIPVILNPPSVGDFICIVSNYSSRSIASRFVRAARRYVPDLKIYAVRRLGGFIKDAARSDHVPYWRDGRKGIMITDTANFRNPNYHQATDTSETLDYEFIVQVSRAAAAMMLDWATE